MTYGSRHRFTKPFDSNCSMNGQQHRIDESYFTYLSLMAIFPFVSPIKRRFMLYDQRMVGQEVHLRVVRGSPDWVVDEMRNASAMQSVHCSSFDCSGHHCTGYHLFFDCRSSIESCYAELRDSWPYRKESSFESSHFIERMRRRLKQRICRPVIRRKSGVVAAVLTYEMITQRNWVRLCSWHFSSDLDGCLWNLSS